MVLMLIVFTAAFGHTDAVRPPLVVAPDIRYLCFSDVPCPAPYEWVPMEAGEDPRRTARQIKILADHPALDSASMTLWHDASYQLTADPVWASALLEGRADVVAMRHPSRQTIEAEAWAIARYGYVELGAAQLRVAFYRAQGFRKNRLTASGLLARRCAPHVVAYGRRWWEEVTTHWGGRDQGSLDYAMWSCGVRLQYVDGTIRDNPYAAWRVPAAVLA